MIRADLHRKYHSELGGGRNTAHEFECYSKEFYGKDYFPWKHEGGLRYMSLDKLECDRVKSRQERAADFLARVNKNQHTFERFTLTPKDEQDTDLSNQVQYENILTTYAIVSCKEHDFKEIKTVANYMQAIYGLSYCSLEAGKKRKPPTKEKNASDQFLTNFFLSAKSNDHVFKHFIGGVYRNRLTEVLISCTVHGLDHTLSVKNYSRNHYGLICCSADCNRKEKKKEKEKRKGI